MNEHPQTAHLTIWIYEILLFGLCASRSWAVLWEKVWKVAIINKKHCFMTLQGTFLRKRQIRRCSNHVPSFGKLWSTKEVRGEIVWSLPIHGKWLFTSHRSQTFNWIFIGSEMFPNWWRCWFYLIDLKFVKLNETLVSRISSHEFFIIKPDVCLAKEKIAAGCIGGVVTLDLIWNATRSFVWESERRIFEKLVNLELNLLLDDNNLAAMVERKLQTS